MTDTAIPMPELPGPRPDGKISTADPGALTAVQRQRAAALDVARQALSNRALFASNNVSGWSVGDLTYVAEWVLGEVVPPILDDEPIEAPPGGLEYVNTFHSPSSALDDAEPVEDDTDVLPSYPEETLPR